MKNAETLDYLWAYCTDNNRLVPMPQQWNTVFGMLKNTGQKPSGGWQPSLPLILAAWYEALPIAKQLRFKEHLAWAEKEGQLDEVGDYLRSLKEQEWCHLGEV